MRVGYSGPTRAARRITHKGRTLTIRQWAYASGLNENTIRARLRNGWSEQMAVSLPALVTIEVDGRELTVRQCSRLYGVPVRIIRQRLRNGWEPWRAVKVKPRRYKGHRD